MGHLVRYISADATLSIMAIDSTDIVNDAEKNHVSSAVVSAALGRLLTAASLMGAALKGEGDSVTLRINGGGPVGSVIAVADSKGNARGYVEQAIVELPLNEKGKLDVAAAVGKDGILTVMKDLGLKEPYIGSVPIQTGEIAEDITAYFAISEQIPTVCALGVLVDTDLSIKAAGGFIIQLLPFAPDETIDAVERCIKDLPSVTQMLSEGLSPDDICKKALPEFELELLDSSEPAYVCNCSRERTIRALLAVGIEELQAMAEDEETEVCCHFCPKRYIFTAADIRKIIDQAK